jgi:iron-sulfur cluster insertion protein
MIIITEAAQTKIAEVLAEENNPKLHLRMFVQGGGCSGFQYGFTMDEIINEDDLEILNGERSVLVDAMSLQYLENAVVDFKEDLSGAQFSISNPQAASTCGCGSSFSV